MVKKDNPKNITFNLGSIPVAMEGGKIKKKRGRPKKTEEVIVKEQLPHKKFSHKANRALDQLLEATREKEKQEAEKSLRDMIKKQTASLNVLGFGVKGGGLEDDFFEGIERRNRIEKEENELAKSIPQVGQITLKIPPFFAVPTKKGWRLANPLTEMRNLAKRQHQLSLNLKRANVNKPEIDMSVPRSAPTMNMFSEKDQDKLRAYGEAVKEGREQEYLFKNKPRGFPPTLYKNAIKAGYKETDKKVYTKNPKKVITPKKVKTPKKRQLIIEGDEEDQIAPPEPPSPKTPKPVEKPKETEKPAEVVRRYTESELTAIMTNLVKKVDKYVEQMEAKPPLEVDKKLMNEVSAYIDQLREEIANEKDPELKRRMPLQYNTLKDAYNKLVRARREARGRGLKTEVEKISDYSEGGSLLGSITKTAYNALVKPKVEQVKKNIHRITHPKETLQEVKDFGRHLIHGRHDAYPPSAQKVIDANKDAIVQSITLHRNPLPSTYTTIMSWATKGETDKRIKEQPKDTLYHIGMWVKLSNGKTIKVEKNEVINIQVNPKKPKEEEVFQVPNPPPNLTFGEMLSKTREAIGDHKFFSYSAKDNNCGNFIEAILKTNGMDSQATHDFIGQDAKAILKGFPSLRKFMNTLTDIAGRANVVLEGGDIDAQAQAHMKGKGLGLKIARKLYDWWKPAIPYEEWREREQGRFRTDAEAEYALEQAKADRRLAEAERALERLRKDTEEHKQKLHEIRERKLQLANEYGVWVGDEDNYVNWDEVREHMERGKMEAEDKHSKRAEENKKIEEEEPDWDTGAGLKPEIIDWEDMKWGSFTKQFEEYKRQHPNSRIGDLEHFANSILANPSDYRKTTLKRARFYLNVLLKKKSHHNNIMPHTQGGRMIGLARPAVLPAHIGHPALVSDQYPRIPQAFAQVHMSHPIPIGHGLYAGGSGLGGSILDDIYGGSRRMLGVGMDMRMCGSGMDYVESEGGRINIGKTLSKAFDPKKNGVAKGAEKFFTKTLPSGLIHKALPAVISGVAGASTSALTGNPALGFAVGQTAGKYAGKKAGDALGKATGYGLRPHLVKGSKEAKEYMASIRKKRGSKGGKIPAPHSRGVITDPSLL